MIISKDLGHGVKVHGIQTGTVAVKEEHYRYSGLGLLRIPRILFGRNFVPPMPIWVWCIETPHGRYLIDTGETVDFYAQDHFAEKSEDWVNRRILRIEVSEQDHIDRQLAAIGLSAAGIDAVIMTHLHLDHTDGMRFFERVPFFISRTDWERPYGAPVSTFPSWLRPTLLTHDSTGLPMASAGTPDPAIRILSTPGHTLGHQSVLLDTGSHQIVFAGDMTFTEAQLQQQQVAGINMDLGRSRQTIRHMQDFIRDANVVYLPSHDPASGARLQNLTVTKPI